MFCPPVAQRGEGKHKPVLSAAARELVTVKPAGLPLMALKRAEDGDGFVFRLCDFSGLGGTAKLSLPKAVTETFICDLVEANANKEADGGKTISAPVKAFSPVTLKARFAAPPVQ